MAIRKDGIIISEEILEKLKSLSFSNDTNLIFTHVEIYLCKLINDLGINFEQIKPLLIFDNRSNHVRNILSFTEKEILCKGSSPSSFISLTFDQAWILPLWEEGRQWLTQHGYKLDFHYDPVFGTENIKIGFMKSKALTGTDNIIIESEGKTDLEVLYKVLLEVIKIEKNL
jgi:hypothetical protein